MVAVAFFVVVFCYRATEVHRAKKRKHISLNNSNQQFHEHHQYHKNTAGKTDCIALEDKY